MLTGRSENLRPVDVVLIIVIIIVIMFTIISSIVSSSSSSSSSISINIISSIIIVIIIMPAALRLGFRARTIGSSLRPFIVWPRPWSTHHSYLDGGTTTKGWLFRNKATNDLLCSLSYVHY